MNFGPIIFLGAFFALATSWFGFVMTPQFQIGQLQETNTVPGSVTYPVSRSGEARQGLEVYRANGCAACHTQDVRQEETLCDVIMTATGTNQAPLIAALRKIRPSLPNEEIGRMLVGLPKAVLQDATRADANQADKELKAAGATSEVHIMPQGPDLARGWGKRQSVAEDFLYDSPVMIGRERIGPDLADVGSRLPDFRWHLQHLYAPRSVVKDSVMPSYRFLFQKRKLNGPPSPDALNVPVEAGYEIVPSKDANAVAAYLLSLRGDVPLYIAPYTPPPAPVTNAPASHAAATNAPAK